MNVGLIIYGSLQHQSGGFLYDRMLADYLIESGDRVFLFSLPWRSYPRHLLDNLQTKLIRAIGRSPLDILLQDELNHPSLFGLNLRLKKRFDRPIVSIVHHLRCMEPRSSFANAVYRSVERAYLKTVDGCIYNSRHTRDNAAGLIGKPQPHVVATPGGDRLGRIDDDHLISERCRRPGPLQLLFIGNVIRRKNLDGLLVGLGRIRQLDWRLNVIGRLDAESSYTAQINDRIKRLGIADKVSLCGSLSDESLQQYLQSNHLIAMPFTYEGFGIVYLEGMAFGLPALGCCRGGAPELIVHGQTGYLFSPDDYDRLAAVVSHFCEQRGELQKMSLAARRRFDDFPVWRETAGTIRHFLKEMVSHAKPRTSP